MNVLVTGGAGFIGSHIVDQLVAAGHDVRVLDILHPATHGSERPAHLRDDVDYRWGDVADPNAADAVIAGVDAVCHQAAMVGLGVDFADVGEYVHHNDAGTAGLLGALHRCGFRGRIVLASSMVVYGEGAYTCTVHGLTRPAPRARADLDAGHFDPRCPRCSGQLAPATVDEDMAVDPRNVYAATKLHQEHLCRAFAREHPGVTVTALRYHNVYGPRMPANTPYAGVASLFASALARGEAPRVFEDGQQRRDFVHVADVARANVVALTAPVPYDGALNVASGTPHTILDCAEALADAAGAGAPRPQVVGGYRLGDVRHIVASPQRARATIGFSAAIDLETGMRELGNALWSRAQFA